MENTTFPTLEAKVKDFLDQPRIAVAGVSASRETPGNMIYRKLKSTGHQVFAIIPGNAMFDGEPSYPDLFSIPGGVDGLVTVTRPSVTTELVEQCIAAGVSRVWMHESLFHGGTSISVEATRLCREHDITLIAGACPMMYCEPVDVGHRCMHWMMGFAGSLPH